MISWQPSSASSILASSQPEFSAMFHLTTQSTSIPLAARASVAASLPRMKL